MNTGEHRREARSREEFIVSTSLLPSIREKYSSVFDVLEIPEVLRFDEREGQHGTVYFRKYIGRTYDDKWTEQTGGSLLGLELSSEMVRLLDDFRKIDLDWLLQLLVGKSIGEVSFDLQHWLEWYRLHRSVAVNLGISDGELRRAEKFVQNDLKQADRVFTNGDFYPRNLIKVGRKIVVIDWEYRSGYRACFIDHLANATAFAFIHMWNNDHWCREFTKDAISILKLTPEDLGKAILIKSFEQALYWQSHPTLVMPQVSIFRMALENAIPM